MTNGMGEGQEKRSPQARPEFYLAPPSEHQPAPLPGEGIEIPSQQVVDEMCAFLRTAGHEPVALELRERYVHRVLPASAEHWRTSEACERQIHNLEQELREKRKERDKASEDFVRFMAEAGLPLPPADQTPGAKAGEPEIGLKLVEEALEQDGAAQDEIAGRHGIEPVHRPSRWESVVKGTANLLLPVAVGVVFGVNLAVLTGFATLEGLQKGRFWVFALVGVVAGIAIEATLGACYAAIARLWAKSLEPARSAEEGSFPRHLGMLVVATLSLVVLLVLGAGIVAVDALGLRTLHEETLANRFVENPEEQLQPLWVYLIAGAVISLPYLIYKFLGAWHSSADNLREARIAFLAQEYRSERRRNVGVSEAFEAAQRYTNLCAEVERIQKEIEDLKQRHDRARDAACEEARQFRQRWDEITAMLQETRVSGDGKSTNGAAHRNGEAPPPSGETTLDGSTPTQTGSGSRLWDRISGIFRRPKSDRGADGYLK